MDITITAQEIIVGFASYPTKKIEINSFDYRPLGLGYANLGALLMSQGMAYDSDHGRDYCRRDHGDHDRRSVSAVREDCRRSRTVRGLCESTAKPFLNVMRMHRDAVKKINREQHSGRTVRRRMERLVGCRGSGRD